MLLMLLLWVPLAATPKHENRLYVHFASRLRKYCCCVGDQFARLVHRGVGGSLRVMVQHARVVIGATSYYHGTIQKLFYCCCSPACFVVCCVMINLLDLYTLESAALYG